MRKLGAYVRLMRPINCLMMGFAVIVGSGLVRGNGHAVLGWNLVYGFVTGFTLTAASMAINDYYDRQIDAVNERHRPIPSGLIKPESALVFALGLTVVGFAVAYFLNIFCLFTAVVAWMIFVLYTTVGKRSGLPGNFLVSLCVTIPFIYGSVAATQRVELNVLLFASMAFLSNTGREVTKGIVDVAGDSAHGVKTLAARFSERIAAIVAVGFYVAAVALSSLPWFLNSVSLWFIPPVVVTDVGLIVSSVMLLRDYSRDNARRVKKIMLLWFMFGLLAFVLGTLR
jgi:geranylgeranylglycerol-phosphate geranylgeranyltransferase